MELHYNAFISYRHHPDDIRVATDIHRCLERFHIPKALKKRNPKGLRLFRDKDELPITSNINDDITNALNNSEFLIVICSVHTKESIWVQREIEVFLKHHDRNHILTVLASGEPYDVIPECLLYEDVTDPETGKTTRIHYEPLSCDWRLPKKKARQEELPRLAAVLLGCSYDELRQRQKQYRARRNAAIISVSFAVLLGLSAYFLYTAITIHKANLQIQENLDTALINQSQHLSSAATERLSAGDRLTAIALAMAALPSGDNVRPYVPAAELALTSALDLYSTANGGFRAIGSISLGDVPILHFRVSDDEAYIYTWDQRSVLSCWDAKSFAHLGSITLESMDMDDFHVTPEGNALVRSASTIFCISPRGDILWQQKDCGAMFITSDKTMLLSLDYDEQLHFYNLADGSVARESMSLPTEEGINYLRFGSSPSAAELPIPIVYTKSAPSAGLLDPKPYGVLLVDLKNNTTTDLFTDHTSMNLTTVTPDGKILFSLEEWSDAPMTGLFGSNRINGPMHYNLYCYDISTREFLWTQECMAYTFTGSNSISPIPGSNRVLCQLGLSLYVLDTQTGQILSHCEAGSSVLDIRADEAKAWAILQDGYLCAFNYDQYYCMEQKCLAGPLADAAVGQNHYGLSQDRTQLITYTAHQANPHWEYTYEDYLGFLDRVQIAGSKLAFQYNRNIYLLDLDAKEPVYAINVPDTSLKFLGFSADGSKLLHVEDDSNLVITDVLTQDAQTIGLPFAADHAPRLYGFTPYADTLTYLEYAQDAITLTGYDWKAQATVFSLPFHQMTEDSNYLNCRIIARTDNYAWVQTPDAEILEVNLSSGRVVTVMENAETIPCAAAKADQTAAVIACGDRVCTKLPGSQDCFTYTLDGAQIGSVQFYGDEILFLCEDGYLYRYDSQGTRLSQIRLSGGGSFSDSLISSYRDSLVNWHFTEDNRLILAACETIHVIDCTKWELCIYIPNGLAYWTNDNSFICRSGSRFMGFDAYTVPQLLEIAREQLGNFRLTPAQKSAYGLD